MAEHENPSIPPLAEWMQSTVAELDLDFRNPDDMDGFLLNRKLSQRAPRYARIATFGNHFRVEDEITAELASYNSGVASIFQELVNGGGESTVNYVGVLKDILELHYGALHNKIILF